MLLTCILANHYVPLIARYKVVLKIKEKEGIQEGNSNIFTDK